MMHESDPIVGEVKGLSMFIRYTAVWLCQGLSGITVLSED